MDRKSRKIQTSLNPEVEEEAALLNHLRQLPRGRRAEVVRRFVMSGFTTVAAADEQ